MPPTPKKREREDLIKIQPEIHPEGVLKWSKAQPGGKSMQTKQGKNSFKQRESKHLMLASKDTFVSAMFG